MKHLKKYNESVPYWKKQELASKAKKEKEAKMKANIFGYEDLGKVVFYKGEYGVLILSSKFGLKNGENGYPCVCIRWDTGREYDFEDYSGGNWMPDIVTEPHTFKHLNPDGTLKDGRGPQIR